MINFDLLQLDQTNLLFFLLSAIGLIRDRRVLPFVIVALGNILHGSLPAVFLAGLIIWHRVDFSRSRWIQLKDFFGFLLILIGAVAHAPFQEFSIFCGVLAISLSFGRGALGIIPPLLLLRQYIPHPEPLELIMGSAGFYWVMVEALRWSKTSKEYTFRAIIEVVSTLGILFGLRDFALRAAEDPPLIALGWGFAVIALFLFILVKWKGERFWLFFHRSKKTLSSSLGVGNRLVSGHLPWSHEFKETTSLGVDASFDKVFTMTILTLILLGGVFLASRGGFT